MLLQSLVALLTVSSLYSSHAHAAGSDSIVVITDPQRNTLRAVAVNDGGKGLAKDAVDVANEFDFICCTAAAGGLAFTAGTKGTKAILLISSISNDVLEVQRSVPLKGLETGSGFFDGCMLGGEDITVKETVAGFDLYLVLECAADRAPRLAANYVAKYTYAPTTGQLTGPSIEQRYFINKFDTQYGFVSVVNSMAVLGGGKNESGVVYAVMTTTSAANGKIYKPALHILQDQKAVPLGILATTPAFPDGAEPAKFAIASSSSFYSVFRQRCEFLPGANHCKSNPVNAQEEVTLTRKGKQTEVIGARSITNSYSPSALAFSVEQQVLYRLTGSASDSTSVPAAFLEALKVAVANGSDFSKAAELSELSRDADPRHSLLQIAVM